MSSTLLYIRKSNQITLKDIESLPHNRVLETIYCYNNTIRILDNDTWKNLSNETVGKCIIHPHTITPASKVRVYATKQYSVDYLYSNNSTLSILLMMKSNRIYFCACYNRHNYLLQIQSLGQDSSGRQHASIPKVLRRKCNVTVFMNAFVNNPKNVKMIE